MPTALATSWRASLATTGSVTGAAGSAWVSTEGAATSVVAAGSCGGVTAGVRTESATVVGFVACAAASPVGGAVVSAFGAGSVAGGGAAVAGGVAAVDGSVTTTTESSASAGDASPSAVTMAARAATPTRRRRRVPSVATARLAVIEREDTPIRRPATRELENSAPLRVFLVRREPRTGSSLLTGWATPVDVGRRRPVPPSDGSRVGSAEHPGGSRPLVAHGGVDHCRSRRTPRTPLPALVVAALGCALLLRRSAVSCCISGRRAAAATIIATTVTT